ncbi:hypothetical protein LXA43DRAFT_1063538 [Ganoderma leucocontextum]|nr:hypothetical protein LXA43DRAFT_1063538 [Ganoderma leucocontextum]
MSQPPTTGPAQLPAQQPGGDNARALADSQGLATSMHAPQPAPSSQQQQSPAPSNWAGSVMDFDPFGGSGGGGNNMGSFFGFNSNFPTPVATGPGPYPFSINTYPGRAQTVAPAPPMFVPQPAIMPVYPPQSNTLDGWQITFNAAVNTQQIYKERITELSSQNATLRQEIIALQRCLTQSESTLKQCESELESGRRNQYHPYHGDTYWEMRRAAPRQNHSTRNSPGHPSVPALDGLTPPSKTIPTPIGMPGTALPQLGPGPCR